jgi:hypothetical protein
LVFAHVAVVLLHQVLCTDAAGACAVTSLVLFAVINAYHAATNSDDSGNGDRTVVAFVCSGCGI